MTTLNTQATQATQTRYHHHYGIVILKVKNQDKPNAPVLERLTSLPRISSYYKQWRALSFLMPISISSSSDCLSEDRTGQTSPNEIKFFQMTKSFAETFTGGAEAHNALFLNSKKAYVLFKRVHAKLDESGDHVIYYKPVPDPQNPDHSVHSLRLKVVHRID
jgi:hypothetical protein